MIEHDILQFQFVSKLSETSYYTVEVYESTAGLWKSFVIKDERLKQALLPLLNDWRMDVCFHCNDVILMVPYQPVISLSSTLAKITDFDEGIYLLQRLFLTLQNQHPPSAIQNMLCDQKNLVLDLSGNWQLYANPHFEMLLRKNTEDEDAWKRLCMRVLEHLQKEHYASYPLPQNYLAFQMKMQAPGFLSFDEILGELESLKGCYQEVHHVPKRYHQWFRNLGIIILSFMLMLSVAFFAYEYVQQRRGYFHEIEQIGDVKVNAHE